MRVDKLLALTALAKGSPPVRAATTCSCGSPLGGCQCHKRWDCELMAPGSAVRKLCNLARALTRARTPTEKTAMTDRTLASPVYDSGRHPLLDYFEAGSLLMRIALEIQSGGNASYQDALEDATKRRPDLVAILASGPGSDEGPPFTAPPYGQTPGQFRLMEAVRTAMREHQLSSFAEGLDWCRRFRPELIAKAGRELREAL
jgi:hypothetical protein